MDSSNMETLATCIRRGYGYEITIIIDRGSELQRVPDHNDMLDRLNKRAQDMSFQDLASFFDKKHRRLDSLDPDK